MFHTFLALLLSLVLCFYTSLHQYVHSFEHHEETIDHIHTDGDDCGRGSSGFAFEEHHHHCDYLTQVLPHYLKGEVSYYLDIWETKQYSSFPLMGYIAWFDNEHHSFFLRGPPAFA